MSTKRLLKRIYLLFIIALLVIPFGVFAEEENDPANNPTPTETPTPSPSPIPEDKPTVSKVELEKEISITTDEEKSLAPKVYLSNGNLADNGTYSISYTSSDEEVVSVDKTGKIKGLAAGKATITVTADNKSETSEVTVIDNSKIILTGIEFSKGKLTEKFTTEKKEYTLLIGPKDTITEDDIKPITNNKKKVMKVNLDSKNKIRIVVTADDVYIINIQKQEVVLTLKSLSIKGYSLKEAFAPDKLVYSAVIPYEASDVTVEAATEDPNAEVKIKGASGLSIGDNVVTVTVTDGEKTNIYRINVTREKESERVITGNTTKYSNPNKVTSTHSGSKAVIKDTSIHHPLRYFFVTLGSIVLLAIGGIGIYFYIITSKKQLKKAMVASLKKDKDKFKKEQDNSEETNEEIQPVDIDLTSEYKDENIKEND